MHYMPCKHPIIRVVQINSKEPFPAFVIIVITNVCIYDMQLGLGFRLGYWNLALESAMILSK